MTEAQSLSVGTTVGLLLHYFVVTDRLAPSARPVSVEESDGSERVTVSGNEVETGDDVEITAWVTPDGSRRVAQEVRVWDEACHTMGSRERVLDFEVDDHIHRLLNQNRAYRAES